MISGRDLDSLAPLVAGPVAWTPAGDDHPPRVSIDAGDRVIDVEGDLVAAIVSDCDGRTTVSELVARHGAEARELIAAMLEAGAVVDGADAWRVFHAQGSVGSTLGTAASAEVVAELQRGRYRPEAAAGDAIPLTPARGAVRDLAMARRSMTPDTPPSTPDLERLSTLLASSNFVRDADPSGSVKTGGNASAGALYGLIVHVVLRAPLESPDGGLPAGVYWHDPFEQCLLPLPGEAAAAEELFIPEPNCDQLLRRGGPLVFISAEVGGPARKYGPRAYRYALIEAGAAMQSAYLAATELGIPLRAIGGIDDSATHAYLGLPDSAVALLALIAG